MVGTRGMFGVKQFAGYFVDTVEMEMAKRMVWKIHYHIGKENMTIGRQILVENLVILQINLMRAQREATERGMPGDFRGLNYEIRSSMRDLGLLSLPSKTIAGIDPFKIMSEIREKERKKDGRSTNKPPAVRKALADEARRVADSNSGKQGEQNNDQSGAASGKIDSSSS